MTKKNEFFRVIHGIEMSFIFKFKLLNKKKIVTNMMIVLKENSL